MRERILIVVQNFSVPKDTRVWFESLALTEHGYNVTVLCPRAEGEAHYERLEGIEIYRCPVYTPLGGMIGYVFEYLWSFFIFTALILLLHLRFRFNSIQVCNPPDFFFHIGWLCKLTRTRFVFDQHDLCPELLLTKFPKSKGLLYKAAIWMEGATHSTADAIISTNTSYAQLAMERHKVPVDKLWIVRNGPRIDEFDKMEADPELKRGYKYMVVYGGEIAEQDGVDVLVEVVRKVVFEFKRTDVLFAVIGDGSALDSVKKMANDLKVNKWIYFGGWVKLAELIKYMKTADVCISPEPSSPLNDRSTLVKVTEYMAAGKPIIAYALQETMVTAADAAMYAHSDSIDELAENLVKTLDDPEKRLSMQRAALARRDLLSWDVSKKVLVNMYDRLLRRKSSNDTAYLEEQRGWEMLSAHSLNSVSSTEQVHS
jgi:glycosyltransferase involved in cell wall biosynthesis